MIHLGVASRCPLLLSDMIRSIVSSRLWTVAPWSCVELEITPATMGGLRWEDMSVGQCSGLVARGAGSHVGHP